MKILFATFMKLALLLCFVGCGYTYMPDGDPFFSTTSTAEREYQIRWTNEWLNWAEENDVRLIGAYIISPKCDTTNRILEFDQKLTITVMSPQSVLVSTDSGSNQAIHCEASFNSMSFGPKYVEKGYDSADWASETTIVFE